MLEATNESMRKPMGTRGLFRIIYSQIGQIIIFLNFALEFKIYIK